MTNMKIFGSIVVKNEATRYLEPCLSHMSAFVDGIFVWDDQSDDDTPSISKKYGEVVVRPNEVPSFLEHEGEFRFAAWQAMEETLPLRANDWILAFDADEFLVGSADDFSDVRGKLEQAINYAGSKNGVWLPFLEIFATEWPDTLMVRVDGMWNTIRGARLFRYMRGGKWTNKTMGCGSEPTYVLSGGVISSKNFDLQMLHFGYADSEDRKHKYARYAELHDHGHNNKHIQSIIQRPTLVKWDGPIPDWRST